MAARMDLEARLRALRNPKAPRPAPAAPQMTPPPPPPALQMAPPPVIVVAAPPPPPPPPPAEPVVAPPRPRSFSRPRPNFAALSTPAAPPPTAPRPPTQLKAQPSNQLAPPPPQQQPPMDMAKILGPAYESVVAQAQFAIECERKRLVHTAIDGYIASGQALVALGRQQKVPHLQNILRTKALALLQRAEGLEAWATRVIAELHAHEQAMAAANGTTVAPRTQEETLRAAFAHSQEKEEQALIEKAALVAKMKTQNTEMQQKLNQLVVLTKVKARFRRVISERRARKAEEQRQRAESESSSSRHETEDDEHDVDTERSQSVAEEGEDDDEYHEDDDAHREEEVHGDKPPTTARPVSSSLPTSLSSSPREEQKRSLVNELHALIGLPQVDQFRTFKPLAETADSDRRREELARELEEARQEAERMRAAVQEMEDTLRAAAEHSRQRSIKLEKEKEDEVAQLQAELARMKSALEIERRSSSKRSSLYLDSDEDEESLRKRDPDAYEDREIINKLRLSLQGMDQDDGESPRERRNSSASGRASRSIARKSEDHSSPRRRTETMGSWGFDRDDETFEEGESDDGLWV